MGEMPCGEKNEDGDTCLQRRSGSVFTLGHKAAPFLLAPYSVGSWSVLRPIKDADQVTNNGFC
jgi:hypothetical protein